MKIDQDNLIGFAAIAIVLGLLSWFGLFIYGNYRVCSVYYSEIGTLACMASSKTSLPSRGSK